MTQTLATGSRVVRIHGRDPLLFRDGRPFGAEPGSLAARTLPLPLPGTLGGFIRTGVGNALGWNWQDPTDGPRRARELAVAGPLLALDETPVFAAPADAVVHLDEATDAPQVMALRPRPLPPGAGCDLSDPRLLSLRVTAEVKPLSGYSFWKAEDLWRWLAATEDEPGLVPDAIGAPEREERVHVAIDPRTGANLTGALYSTEGICLGERWSLLARYFGPESAPPFEGFGSLGGERRLARIVPAEADAWPTCPPAIQSALRNTRYVRLQLATPALFQQGWRPDWLDARSLGHPPGLPEVTLRLVSAAVPRREPVSGWDFQTRGPKPVRWLAPAGSVYFFAVEGGDPAILAEQGWLQPVSDLEPDRRDGYGLALWGVWSGIPAQAR